jgi:hypothetical protein
VARPREASESQRVLDGDAIVQLVDTPGRFTLVKLINALKCVAMMARIWTWYGPGRKAEKRRTYEAVAEEGTPRWATMWPGILIGCEAKMPRGARC